VTTDAQWEQIKNVVHQALQLAAGERARFLDEVCGSNAELRGEVDSLLLANAGIGASFLNSPMLINLREDPQEIGTVDSLAPGQVFAQRFQLVRRLGEGGMGQVWLADQISPVHRQVALKLIRAGMYDETVLQRFVSERQSIAIMDHPCIAKVFDAGATPQGQPYFVMEYVPGLPITEYCDQKKLSIPERLELFIQACEGVQHAHQKAIIHRDLKPANILVIEVDGKATPRIIDFGLAKAITPQVADQTLFTRFGQFIGTPGYMSPEQVDPTAQDIDTRTDVYSLGVVLYVLLTGLKPFEIRPRRKQTLDEWLRRLREDEPPNPSAKVSSDRDTSSASAAARSTGPKQLVRLLRGDLDWITLKALERERERRYGTPTELAADLRRYLDHEPVLARPASAAYQTRKFIRRHRIAAAFVGMVTLLSIVASSAALIAVRRQHEAEFQRREAEYQATQALQAQSRLLTQAAAQRLKDFDLAGAQGIILEVLTNPRFAQGNIPAAIGVFQEGRATDRQLALLSGHGGIVFSAAYSPDGTRIVTASDDKTARICDARTGMQLAVLSGHGDRVRSAAYSPDGTAIVTASSDKTARIWDARTGMQLAVLSGHGDPVRSAAYSPDGTRIVTASADKTVRIWDAHTGAQLAVLSGHGDIVNGAVYSPDGGRIVTASKDTTARIWDARTGAQLAVLSGHGALVYYAAYSPDGTRIVTASTDKTARIWDARTSTQVAVLSGHRNAVAGASYSPDGARIVTASADKTARIWDAHSGTQLAVLSGHGDIVGSAVYSPDGARIVTASKDKTARIWDARTGAQLAVLSGHADFVDAAVYSPDGTRIVTASADKTARIWDARTGMQLAVLSGHYDRVYYAAAYSPDGTRIVTASDDNTARIWDARTGTQLAVLFGHGDRVEMAAYSPDGTRIVTASADNTARIWDAYVPASIEAQITWAASAVTDPLPNFDRTQLGLQSDSRARMWSTDGSACDQAAAAYYDPDRVAAGVSQANINVDIAGPACLRELAKPRYAARSDYQMGRALLAKGDVHGAQRHLERAVSKGYRVARVDLADLLVTANASAMTLDPRRALSLYEQAWQSGVPIAAFRLARLYEVGSPASDNSAGVAFQSDASKAWLWYQRGADAGEPHALARFAERHENNAFTLTDPSKRNAQLLQGFRIYATAAEHAREEDWPDEEWKHWRYRRASLARVLAKEGMMQQVADAYSAILDQSTSSPATLSAQVSAAPHH